MNPFYGDACSADITAASAASSGSSAVAAASLARTERACCISSAPSHFAITIVATPLPIKFMLLPKHQIILDISYAWQNDSRSQTQHVNALAVTNLLGS